VLERSNVFVVPLDEARRAYRYHHLFAQYLRAELAYREPSLDIRSARRAALARCLIGHHSMDTKLRGDRFQNACPPTSA
jgi:LuxR family maltose regulon positive regulatory protein